MPKRWRESSIASLPGITGIPPAWCRSCAKFQGGLRLDFAGDHRPPADHAGRAAHQDRGCRRLLFLLYTPAARQVSRAVLRQHHRPHARQPAADGAPVQQPCGSSAAKVSGMAWSASARRRYTGMCDQGPALLVNNLAIAGLTEARIDQIAELIRNKVPLADWPAGSSGRGQHPPGRHPAHRRLQAGRGTARRPRPGAGRRADGLQHAFLARRLAETAWAGRLPCSTDQARQPARPQRRRLHHRPEMGGLPECPAQGRAPASWCAMPTGEPGTFKDRVLLSTFPIWCSRA